MQRLLRSIGSFHAGHGRLLQPELAALAEDGQRPQVMMITCADSRILIDPLVNSEPGVVFTVRNVGNLVPNDGADHSVSSAVAFAIEALHVPDIVVMGHSECGAMKALLKPHAEGTVGEWLRYGDESVEHLGEHPCGGGVKDYDCLSQQNVLTQVERVRAMPEVQAAGTHVHGWWWDMANARVMAYDGEKFVQLEEAYATTVKPSRGWRSVMGKMRGRKSVAYASE